MNERIDIRPLPPQAGATLEGDFWSPETDEERAALREQLDRLLASSVFKNSKGCSSFLAHIVHRAIGGEAGSLKERVLGVQVFGRAPDYDTSTDHVVRSMAGEVRKRLAQYYMEPGRSGEIRIDVPSGTYVPRFRIFPLRPAVVADTPPAVAEPVATLATQVRSRSRTVVALAVAVVAVVSALGIGAMISEGPDEMLHRFWRPLFSSRNPVLLCIGNGDWPDKAGNASGQPVSPMAFHVMDSQKVYLNDSITLAKIAGLLQQNATRFRILPQANATFGDFQTAPAILIGLRSNYWTTNLAGRLRFTVEPGAAPHTMIVRDRKNPSRKDWTVDLTAPYTQATTDYALVVRVLDRKTDQIVVVAAGITHLGTLAAGEFLTNPAQMRKLDPFAPKGWEHKNVAIVLSTEVIRGSAGSPNIVATDFW